uniref:(northern house mosquito) hypothetical protein n=1 Tax=Culex pipiens TaxID=7175 RepID=A0A8D8I651_CULPI
MLEFHRFPPAVLFTLSHKLIDPTLAPNGIVIIIVSYRKLGHAFSSIVFLKQATDREGELILRIYFSRKAHEKTNEKIEFFYRPLSLKCVTVLCKYSARFSRSSQMAD